MDRNQWPAWAGIRKLDADIRSFLAGRGVDPDGLAFVARDLHGKCRGFAFLNFAGTLEELQAALAGSEMEGRDIRAGSGHAACRNSCRMKDGRALDAQREALLVRAAHVEARRQRALVQHDIDTQRYCERELSQLWRQWAARPTCDRV